MADTLYVVLGASGHVGGTISERLLDARKRVRVVARHADKLKGLGARGAEVVPGSVEDPAFLRRALDGAGAAFVLLPPYLGPGIRDWQDRTAAAIGDALEAAKVPRAVSLSSIGADKPSGNGPIAGVHALERRLDRIRGLVPLHLRPGYFFENNLAAIGMIKAMGGLGGALRADVKMAHIAAHDIGEAAANRLAVLDWTGRTVQELQGERDLTMPEVAAALGRAIGKPELGYVQFPYADAEKGMVAAGLPQELAALYGEMARGFNDGHLAPTQRRSAATTTPTSIERWAAQVFAPAFAAG
ncbi:MAG TPA: NAD(P)H-binding protein [Anaeromyxobacter sp.]|nr:NAD(P)H-binding protein [Anaeromyxobacter sp.]